MSFPYISQHEIKPAPGSGQNMARYQWHRQKFGTIVIRSVKTGWQLWYQGPPLFGHIGWRRRGGKR